MAYIYDILLNFNKKLIEYFEWEESDNIKYVKKIILFKVDSNVIKDIRDYEILFDKSFTDKIPKYEMNGNKDAAKVCLLTDSFIVIAVLIKNNKVSLISRLLLDEEFEVLEAANHIEETEIKYKKLKKKKLENTNLTRKEKLKRDKLSDEIDDLYNKKEIKGLMYLYYEYTNKENNNIDYIYKYLKESLDSFNEKHLELLDILLMTKTSND